MELLIPVGEMKSLYQAINNGADAVYLALKRFGARAYAVNFSYEEVREAQKICKLYGVKLYVTMNTLVKDDEVDDFLSDVYFLYSIGVDAIIMQDFGMISLCLKKYPNLEIHASTQVNNASYETIKLLYEMGVKRVVLPREMDISLIEKINIPIELEVFVHGALCVCYSGNCLFSSMLGNRSANRGECVGSCRSYYKLFDGNDLIDSGYLLSMKELNSGEDVLKLPSNVTSLKVEGRMKGASYVSFITKYYRKILDGGDVSHEELEELKSIFYRKYTKGHLFNDSDLINKDSPNHLGRHLGSVVSFDDEMIKIKLDAPLKQGDAIRFRNANKGMYVNYLYDKSFNLINKAKSGDTILVDNKVSLKDIDEVRKTKDIDLEVSDEVISKKIPVKISFYAKKNEEFILRISDFVNEVEYKGSIVDLALSNPISKERVQDQLGKLGNSPFVAVSFDIEMDNDIFIRIGDLNIARRTLVERLIGLRINNKKEALVKKVKFDYIDEGGKLDISKYQMAERNGFHLDIKNHLIVSNLVDPKGYDVIGYYPLNVYNAYSVYYLYKLGYKGIMVSTELNKEEINKLCSNVRSEFGNIPLIIKNKGLVEVMIIKGNVLNIKDSHDYYLVNGHNDRFKVTYDGVFTHIFSSYALNLLESDFKVDNLYFTS